MRLSGLRCWLVWGQWVGVDGGCWLCAVLVVLCCWEPCVQRYITQHTKRWLACTRMVTYYRLRLPTAHAGARVCHVPSRLAVTRASIA